MKKFLKTIFTVAAIMTAFSFASCSDSDDDDGDKKPAGGNSDTVLFTLDYTGATQPENDYVSTGESYDQNSSFGNGCLSITNPWAEYTINPKNFPNLKDAKKIKVELKYTSDVSFGDNDNDRLMIGLIIQDSSNTITNLSWTALYDKSEDGAVTDYKTLTKDINWEPKYNESGTPSTLVDDFAKVKQLKIYTTNMTTGTVSIKSIKFIK